MRRIELFAAGVAAATAIIYFLIGFEVLAIGQPADGSAPDILVFGLLSGAAFLLVAGLLLAVRRRWAWIAIAVFDALTIVAYFAVAEVRDPPFETWGLLIKALQVVLMAAVVYLIVRARSPDSAAEDDDRTRVAHPA
jgi:hypothetical protein